MAATTTTGCVLSSNNNALVIAGYSIIKQTAGYYSDRYIGFAKGKDAAKPDVYDTFVGIAVLTYDFNNRKYVFLKKDGNNTDDFTYQLTDGMANSRFMSYNQPAPIAMTAARLTGSENVEYLMIDGSVCRMDMSKNRFVDDKEVDLMQRFYYTDAYTAGVDASTVNPSTRTSLTAPIYLNIWIKQSVAGNATGDALGKEHIYSVLTNYYSYPGSIYTGSKTLSLEYAGVPKENETIGFRPDLSVKMFNASADDISLGRWTSLCLQDVDAGDGTVAEFKGRIFSYSKPAVVAVLAAPPYFKDLADKSPTDSYTGADNTSFSTTITEGDSHTASVNRSFDVYVVGGTNWPAGMFEAKVGISLQYGYEFQKGWSQTIETTLSNNTDKDQVVISALPMDMLFYAVKTKDKNGAIVEEPMIVKSPYAPTQIMMSVANYDSIAKNFPELQQIGGYILTHTAGDPDSYKGNRTPVKGGSTIITKAEVPSSHHNATAWNSAQAGGTISLDVTSDDSHTVSFEVGPFIAVQAYVVVGAGFESKITAGYSFMHFNSKGNSFSGQADWINISEEPENAAFNFNWGIRNYVVETEYVNSKKEKEKMEFPVLTYETKDVTRPLKAPTNLAVDEAATTINQIVLTWTPTLNASKQRLQFRNKSAGNTVWSPAVVINDGTTATYTHPGLTEGTVYEYRLCAISSLGVESLYTPVCTANTKVSSMPTFATDVQDVTVKEGQSATFSVSVNRGRGPDSQLDYQWQELRDNVWTAISNAYQASYTIPGTSKSDAGRKFRCIVTETKSGMPAVITSSTGELKILKDDAAVVLNLSASTGAITYNSTPGTQITLTAKVSSTSALVGNKAGTVTFFIVLPGDTTSVTLVGAGSMISNEYVATATFTATYAGAHTITAIYAGNNDYQSAESTPPETYTAGYPPGMKMLVLIDSLGNDYYDLATISAVYGESALYKVSIGELQGDGSVNKTLLQTSALTLSGANFSIADESGDIKFSCIKAGTSTETLSYTSGSTYTFNLNLEGYQRSVTVIVDNKEVSLPGSLPTLTATVEDATDANTPAGRGFLSTDASEFADFGDYLKCPTFNGNVRGTYPVTVDLSSAPPVFNNYDLQQRLPPFV
jgi:hypothetical protein